MSVPQGCVRRNVLVVALLLVLVAGATNHFRRVVTPPIESDPVPAALLGTWQGTVRDPGDFVITLNRRSCHIRDRFNHVEGTYPTRFVKQRKNTYFLRVGHETYAIGVFSDQNAQWFEDYQGPRPTFAHGGSSHEDEQLPTCLSRVVQR